MRKSVEIDDDIFAALKRMREERRISFKEAVNETMRVGIRKLLCSENRAIPLNAQTHDIAQQSLDEETP
jgi:hypothetical protein